ncbi:MAG: hypothetical protein Q9190_007831, partial [Brigantiaea leucoxantha]
NLLGLILPEGNDVELEGERRKAEILSATGKIWEICDGLMALAEKGVVWLVVRRAREWEELVKDAVGEVEGWDPDDDEEDEWSGSSSIKAESDKINNARVSNDSLQEKDIKLENINKLKTKTVKILKLIRLLYPAVRKRRLLTFPPLDKHIDADAFPAETQIGKLDQMMETLHAFSEDIDETAAALYDGDEVEVEKRLKALREKAESFIKGIANNWKGEADEFTVWSGKWVDRVAEV